MIIIAILTGVVTGMLSGLLGIGGGAILVASAVFSLGIGQHAAQAAAIAATIPTAMVGVYKHHRNKLINYHVAIHLALGVTAGAMAGAYMANAISATLLRQIFSVFFGLMSIQMFWSAREKRDKNKENSTEKSK